MQGFWARTNLCSSVFFTASSLICSSSISEEHVAHFASLTVQEWHYIVLKR